MYIYIPIYIYLDASEALESARLDLATKLYTGGSRGHLLTHSCIYMYKYVYIYTHISIYLSIYVYVYMYICIYISPDPRLAA